MRVMVIVKADKNTEAGVFPDEKLLTEMGKYNEELVKAPNPTGEEAEIEIRQVFEAEDFGAEFTPELREQAAPARADREAEHVVTPESGRADVIQISLLCGLRKLFGVR